MELIRNIALMGISTSMRLGFGMLSFVVMARMLGPTHFGILMLWLSIATLLSLVANYGLTPFLLREIGAQPDRAITIMSDVLSAKLLLTTFVLLAAACSLSWINTSNRLIFGLLLSAQLADSLTEFFNVGFRATNRFDDEARIATGAAILQCAVITLALAWRATPVIAAAAFLIARTLVLSGTWIAQLQYFSTLRPTGFKTAWCRLRETKAYAIDFGLQGLLGQVDSLAINHFVGPSAIGVYQAGMKLFNGGAQAAPVLANVFLPRAAGAVGKKAAFRLESIYIQWAFTTFGAIFGFGLAVSAESLVHLLFGDQYRDLVAVLPWFGLLFFIRLFASSWGVLLTSAGEQTYRAAINIVQWLLIGALSFSMVPRFGIVGWLACLTVGNAFLAMAYFMKGRHLSDVGFHHALVSAIFSLAFLPFLSLPAQ